MVNGFSIHNTPEENSAALQTALDRGGEITIDEAGIYDISAMLLLSDNTMLRCAPGVIFRRQKCTGETNYCLANRGMYTRETNHNIHILGLTLVTNGVESASYSENTQNAVLGMRGHLAFRYVEDLEIHDFTVRDLQKKDYAIQICDFSRVVLENLYIEGLKDGVHFGPGSDFVVRHGYFKTFDDPIALNGSDYSVSNPTLGWIENGLIEDCHDLAAESTTGFFTRILSGAWVEWFKDMEVQQSDAVVYNHRLYRVAMAPNGEKYISHTPPMHESGIAEIDGICWVRTQDECYTAGCRNITFRDITLRKNRGTAFGFIMSEDPYQRCYYPHAPLPLENGFVFDNVRVLGKIQNFIYAEGTVDDIRVIHSDLADSRIAFKAREVAGLKYPETNLILMANRMTSETAPIVSSDGIPVRLHAVCNSTATGFRPTIAGEVLMTD